MSNLQGYHDKNSRVAGVWNIIECVSLSGTSEATGVEGTEFLLTESGDVDWKLKEGGQNLPLFECQMYELYTYKNLQCYVNRTLIRFVGYKGHIIEFRLDQPVMSEDLMLLTYDGWFMLQCEKLPSAKCNPYQPYSLLSAYREGFFSDTTIISKNKKEFPCHSIVLEASLPNLKVISESDSFEILNGLQDDVLETLLHYLYSRSLPEDLLLATAKQCILTTEHISDLDDFRRACLIYGRNICFRNNFILIVNMVHESLKNILDVFSSSLQTSSPTQIISNLKIAFKHLAVGIVKVLEVCMEFEKAGDILVLSEQRELMMYVRSHVPLLLTRVIDILKSVKNIFVSMTTHTRQELAVLLVPEIRCAFHIIIYNMTKLRKSLEQIIQVSSLSIDMVHSPHTLLSNTLRHDLHLRELQKLRILQENLSSLTNSILYKMEEFEITEPNLRVREVARVLELTASELRDLIFRMQEILHAIDDLFDCSEFKFVFKGATSKIRRIIEKLCSNSEVIEVLIQDMIDLINDSTFTEAILRLGFLKRGSSDEASPAEPSHKNQGNGKAHLGSCSSSTVSDSSKEGEVLEGFSEISLSEESFAFREENCHKKKQEAENRYFRSSRRKGLSKSLPHDGSHAYSEGATNQELFYETELPMQLQDEAQKLNLVKRVCSLPSRNESTLASSLLSYLESSRLVDMTFMVIPPEEEGYYNSSCDSVSSGSPVKECNSSVKPKTDAIISCANDSLDSPFQACETSRQIRKVKKSFSLDRPLQKQTVRTALHRRCNVSFRHSLSLDAGSVNVNCDTCLLSEEKPDSSTQRSPLPSTNSDSYEDSSATIETDATMHKDSIDSTFDSLSHSVESVCHPYSELKSSRGFPPSGKREAKCGVELKAHRVVIASRCEWFKRALLSGMREAIDRHIEVPGVSLPVFKLFLCYLYGGEVDSTILQLDELVDLLVLVDHYGVDSLKALIEQCLESKVDDDSAVPLMMVAYHCNATKLKDICLQHCALKRNYEMLNQLPVELRQQLVATIKSLKKWHRHGLEEGLIEFSFEGENVCDGGWDSPTSLDPLIDDESSSLLTGAQDSGSSSE